MSFLSILKKLSMNIKKSAFVHLQGLLLFIVLLQNKHTNVLTTTTTTNNNNTENGESLVSAQP